MSRSSLKALVAALAATVLGGTAVFGLHAVLTFYEAELAHSRLPEDTVMVMVASRDLYPGIPITDDDLVAIRLAPRLLPEGVFLSPDHVVGQRPKERILRNEFVRAARLANPENGDGLNAVIPAEMRALSVEVQDGAAVSGFVDPGNYVDLLVTMDTTSDRPRGGEPRSLTLAQDVFVLGVNGESGVSSADPRHSRKGSITLLVTPEQAEQVAHAEAAGKLRFTLRPDNDRSRMALADLEEVYEPAPIRVKPVVVEDPDDPRFIRFIHGTRVEDEQIDDTGHTP